jgi:predicted permease
MEIAWGDVRTRVEAIPGVLSVGFADRAPLSGSGPTNTVYSSARPPANAAEAVGATRRFVSESYFETLGIPLATGEIHDEDDRFGVNPVVVINETLARQHFPDEEAVGRTLVLEWSTPMNLEVIGVAADVRERGLGLTPPPVFYLPARWDYDMLYLQVKTLGNPLEMATVVAEAVRRSDPDIVVSDLQTLEASIAASLFEPRFRSMVVGIFALVAVILSLIGLYGVLSYYVRERAHEISVRLALGASHGGVTGWVLVRGMALVALGIGFGLVGALAGGRVVRSVLFGVESSDPLTLFWVSAVLALVGFMACILPALRANRVEPAEVLKAE